MATLVKAGQYGQVEPNHLSAQRNGQIYAQLPCVSSINELQNGQFVKYDYAGGEVNYTGAGEWMLVFSEVKLYEAKHTNKDFVLKKDNSVDKKIYPRVFKTAVGDIFTTNLADNTGKSGALAVKDKLTVDAATGILKYNASPATGEMVWQVVKVYTLADGSPAVKIQRIV